MFPFVLPCFAPTAVPQVLPFWISPPGSTLSFHFLSSASALASHYSASALPFLSLPVSASQWASTVLRSSFRCRGPSSVPFGWFPVRFSRILSTKLSVRFLSPFPASLPTAVPQVLARRSHSGVLLCFRCLSARFHFRLRLLGLPLFLSDFPRLASRWLLRYCRFCFRFFGFPFRPPWFPMKSFRFVCTWLSVCFLSSFPASLPTAVPLVLAFRSPSGVSPLPPLSFVRFRFRLRLLSFPLLLFPSSRLPLTVVLSGARLSASLAACCHARGSALVLSFPAYSLPRSHCLASQSLRQLPAFAFRLRPSPWLAL